MTAREAIIIIEEHNKWRKERKLHPSIMSEALDAITEELKLHICICTHPINDSNKCLSCEKPIR